MAVLGIDFGTSNTVAVLGGDGRPARVLAIDGAGWLPSCVYIDADGTLAVGRDAERKARLAPERFEANPKRRIDDREILLGVRVVPVVEAIAAVLRRVVEEARRQLNGPLPDQINLTHPAEWGAARQHILLAAARSAGLGPAVSLVPEPVAAAAHFFSLPGCSTTPGASLAVYDLGGGTFDCAVIGSSATGFTVLAESGLANVGGVDFDQAVVDHLGRTVSAADPVRWQALSRPRNSADRRAARALREDVRAAKETLSRYAQTDLPLPDPFDDALLTRREFEGLIRPVIARTVEVLGGTISRAGFDAGRLGGIYLVGGSSRIPLVATMIAERLGVVPITLDQPETAVATGAALIPGLSLQPGKAARPGGAGSAVTQAGPFRPGVPPADSPAQGIGTAAGPPVLGPPVLGPPVLGPPAGIRPGGRQYESGMQVRRGPDGGAPDGRVRRNRILLVAAGVVAVLIAGTAILIGTRSSGSTADIAAGTQVSAGSAGSSRSPSGPTSSRSAQPPPNPQATPTTPTTLLSSSRSPASSSAASSTTSRTSASRTMTVDPVRCSIVTSATDVTGCMMSVIGSLATLNCSQDPGVLDLDPTTVSQIRTLTASWSACIDRTNNYAAVVFQTTGASGREAMWPFVLRQFTASRSGTWKTGSNSGVYSAGFSSTGIPLVGWKDANLPVLAFIGSTGGSSIDRVVQYWEKALGATITG